jgi:hypothetical protein
MTTPLNTNRTSPSGTRWNYVEVEVLDGQRSLRPTHTCFDYLIFAEPPLLVSQEIEIIVTNNGLPISSKAKVLPHDPAATRIPIQSIQTELEVAAKRTA